jgi:superfamily II DNA or RNA helicase
MPSPVNPVINNKSHPLAGKDILFTRQRHDAKRAGLHWDYRLVLGDKAYSWATKKQMPEPGKAIILFEQPVHDAVYALRKRIYIPPGFYGSGLTTLDYVRKAKVDPETEDNKLVISTKDGERYLLKKLDENKFGKTSWLFKNLTQYKEGPNSTFIHDGNEYRVDDALEQVKNQKVVQANVSDLDWILQYGTPDQERLNKVDLKFPILTTEYGNRLATVDGYHRLFKAKQDGVETVPVKLVDTSKLNTYTRQMLKEAGTFIKTSHLISYVQALDNTSPSLFLDHETNKSLLGDREQQEAYRKIIHSTHGTKLKAESGNVRIERKGDYYRATLFGNARDTANRKAPLIIGFHKKYLSNIEHHLNEAEQKHGEYSSALDGKFKYSPFDHKINSNFSTPNRDRDLHKAIKQVNVLSRNRLLKKIGLGIGIIGAGALGTKLYLDRKEEKNYQEKQPKRRQALLNWGIAPGDKNKYLTKLAKDSAEKLRPQQQAALEKLDKNDSGKLRKHQEEALAKLDKNDGLILHHFLGSGKTITFLTAAKKALDSNPGKEALIVAPASLVTNVDKELTKHKIKLDRKRLNVYSYEKAHNMADELKKKKLAIAISDESHKLRNADAKRTQSLTEVFTRADKRLLSTATGTYNHAADIAPLINIAAGYEALPTKRKDFENRYLRRVIKPQGFIDRMLGKPKEEQTVLTREHELEDLFKEHVHHYDPADDVNAKEDFPSVSEKYVGVDMSPEQLKYYKYHEGKLPFFLRYKIKFGLPLEKQEKANLNAFSTGIRTTSNSYREMLQNPDSAEFTPKIERAVKSLQEKMKADKNYRGLVYSNYLESGVNEYSRLLSKKGIKHGVFTGKLNQSEKDKLRDDLNSGKLPVLLISSSGAEGLDLKGVKHVQVLEPHWNPSKIKQVIGRASRYKSHNHLPKEERKVEVEHFLSTYPKSITGVRPSSIDVYLNGMSDEKDEVFDKIKRMMKEQS